MSISVLLEQVLIIFLEIGIGLIGGKTGILDGRGSKLLSNLVITFTLPCTLLASTDVDSNPKTVLLMLLGAVLLLVLYMVTTLLCLWLSRILHLSRAKRAILVALAVMPNSAFVGIPLCRALLDESIGMIYAASGIIAYNLFFFIYVVQLFQSDKKFELKNLITPVNLVTLLMIVMLLTRIRLPNVLQSFCSAVGNCTTPLALMIVGIMLAESDWKQLFQKRFLYLITALRCIVFPLAFIGLLYLLPIDSTMRMGVTILASCPAGSLGAVFAKQYEMEPELASQAVAQSTLFILVSIPALLTLANYLFFA